MASSFPFIPRTLVKGKQKVSQHTSQASTSAQVPSPSLNTGTPHITKAKYSNEDYINIFNLALSDYALWVDPDLRRIIDFSTESSSNEQTGDGFFPLSRLIRRSKVLGPLNIENLQVPIAKALRSDATSALEVRLLVSEPSSSAWSGKRDTARDIGAYEVRRRETQARPSRTYSRQDWEDRTVYVESIPVQYRSIPAIMHLVNSLLSERSLPEPHAARVQGVILPPHHQDKPGDAPTCKGFALVVFQDILDVEFLLQRWPWDRHQDTDLQNPEAPAEVSEATKFGFRALSKSRWDRLKDEYLSYRERLVAEINAFQDATERPVPTLPVPNPKAETAITNHAAPAPLEPPRLDNTSPYPFNSLIFVRNIHPETNKTTLRKLFGRAFESSTEVNSDGIDYVDYNKGMDSCHLRLATPEHARILVNHFLSNQTIHSNGLDETGKPSDGTSPPVLMELVPGKREQLYWEKVPEKVRRQAVQKALASVQDASALNVGNGRGDEDGCEGEGDTRKRKRRRR
ncbi:Protein pof8 [Termitomyces sp. J132]|nr:hypothetical protein H2248_006933 [Termitomyces sp. 'cryptogamus']KNZ72704.1 Protein pof8 [Termitomyces sp. J132]